MHSIARQKEAQLEGHSVEHITSDKGRYPTAQLIYVFLLCLTLTFDLELLQLTHLLAVVGAIYAPNFVKICRGQ